MSNHRTPLTEIERSGLVAHGMERQIGKPSMLADVFRQGVAWALMTQEERDRHIEARKRLDLLLGAQEGDGDG